MPTAIQTKFMTARTEITAALIERDAETDLVLTALICHENPLLVGPPGTGKTLLMDSICEWINGSTKKFKYALTKFTMPEELFGPIDLMQMKAGKYVRVTAGKLPEADVGYIDEFWNGSSAIGNTLHYMMNERMYNNGGVDVKIPLLMLLASSNRFPGDDDKEMGAIFDRFLFRKKVVPIKSAMGRRRLLWGGDHKPKFSQHISRDEITQAGVEAAALPFTQDATDAFEHILSDLAKDGVCPGDRRQYKSVNACRAYAYLCGKDKVEAEDLVVLMHTLWDDPTEQPERVMRIVLKNATPEAQVVNDLLMTVEDVVAKAQPIEAVPKLQAILKEVKKTAANTHRDKAIAYINETLQELKKKVLGID